MGNRREQLQIHEDKRGEEKEAAAAVTEPSSVDGGGGGPVSIRNQIKKRPLRLKIKVPKREFDQTAPRLRDHNLSDEENAKNPIQGGGGGGGGGGRPSIHLKDSNEENRCCVCGKEFPSDKALYGHMRLHPNRGWKGVRPPRMMIQKNRNGIIISSSSSLLNSPTAQIPDKSAGESNPWNTRVTAKRTPVIAMPCSAHSTTKMNVSQVSQQDSITDAVRNLMMLAAGDPPQDLPHKKIKRSSEEELEAADNGDSHVFKKEVKERESCSANHSSSDEGEEEENNDVKYQEPRKDFTDTRVKVNGEKKRKKKTVRDLLIPNCKDSFIHKKLAGRFTCSTCKKSFPTHQALGGHRASHKKDRAEGEQDGATDPSREANEARPTPAEHQCKICNKAFPTGQALGGHQRRHWGGPVEDAGSSTITSQDDNGKAGVRRPLLDFDLNEPAPLD